MKRLLFIAWDGPQLTYLEGLFVPIFEEIQKYAEIEFHLMQFTWGDNQKIEKRKIVLEKKGFRYIPVRVKRSIHPVLGIPFTIYDGAAWIKKYIINNEINIVMPRATMSAVMLNMLHQKLPEVKVIFDADGLPIEERVDFSGLKRGGIMYNFLKKNEDKILRYSDAVITRSYKAVDIHLQHIGMEYKNKFFRVVNGRDIDLFSSINEDERIRKRQQLGIDANTTVFVYCGSLGPQYCWLEMCAIFKTYLSSHPDAKFIVLTGSLDYLEKEVPVGLKENILIKTVPFDEVPSILSLCDIAFAIRQPSYSMQGVAPIKLAEYLLMGIPTIASIGIGDTEDLLTSASYCYLYKNGNENMDDIMSWCVSLAGKNRLAIRDFAIKNFSLQRSAEDYLKAINYVL